MNENSIIGCILGTAVGDAIGLPYEGLSARRLRRMYKALDRHHLILGRGMVSDDTEHTCMTAQALIESAGEIEAFRADLARRMRWWLLGLPAGIGFGTLRALVKLWVGFSPSNSGVFSAGNGPAMRSAIIGVYCGTDEQKLKDLVRASTGITHTDPKAEYGALAVALAANIASSSEFVSGQAFHERLQNLLAGEPADELLGLISRAVESATRGESTKDFTKALHLQDRVSGYMYHTVPVVIHAWLTHPRDYRGGLMAVIHCGGDTDTTGAILGGIIGAVVGAEGIPEEWLRGLWEWPRTTAWMEALGRGLAEVVANGCPGQMSGLFFPAIILRNVFFAAIVLLHGFRRLLPPFG